MISSFSAFALTRSEMKNVIGGCMPPHWDLRIYNGQGYKGGPQHVACFKTEKAAVKSGHSSQWGKVAREWKYNPGNC